MVLFAVVAPGVTTAFGGGLETKVGIGHHIDPGRRGHLLFGEQGDVLATLFGKATQPIEKLQLWMMWMLEWHGVPWSDDRPGWRERRRVGQAGQLLLQRSTARRQHDTRRREQQIAYLGTHQIGSHRVHRPLCQFGMEAWPRLAAAHGGLDAVLQILHIGGGVFIDDHQIDGKPLHAQILMGEQQLAYLSQVLDIVDTQQQYGQITRDGLLPEHGLRCQALQDGV
ncbi:hypothetical protein D3C72_1397470 [compost metagenome]